ncbi:MAG TPA: hypothetical protein VF192_08420, partial [Longimicrobiales bacterium]
MRDDARDGGTERSRATESAAHPGPPARAAASGGANGASASGWPRRTASSRLETLAFALASALFVYGAHGAFSFPANHDMAWLLHVASRALDGAKLYVDVVEINPPLVIFLSMIVELIARVTGIWDITVFRLLVLGLAAISLLLATPLLRELLGEDRRLARHALLLVFVFSFVALPGMEFGQREHLAMLLTLPYALAVAVRAEGRAVGGSTRCAVLGAMAGVGIALKPFFLPIWLALEAFLAWRRGPRSLARIEHIALLAVLAAYAIGTLMATPEFVPFARRSYSSYASFLQVSLWSLLRSSGMWLAGIALAAAVVVPGPRSTRALRWTLGLACAGFLAAVLLQSKGWEYHWLPVRALAWALLAAVAIDLLPFVLRRVGRSMGGTRRTEPLAAVAPPEATVSDVGSSRPHSPDRLAAVPQPEATISRAMDVLRGRAGPRWAQRRQTPALALTGLALLLLLAAHVVIRSSVANWNQMALTAYRLPEMIRLVEEHGHGGPIAILSTNMQAAFPLVNYTGVPWGLRFNSLFLLSGFYAPTPPGTRRFPYRRPEEMPEGERYVFEATISDIERSRPTLLIIDVMPPGYVLHGFDYLEYFSQDARFRALLEAYQPLTV